MARWLTYARERFPFLVYILLCGGFVASGAMIWGPAWGTPGVLCAYVGLMLFFFTLRLMDERKDYEKDIHAHPTRPMPRGLISPAEAERTIVALTAAMLLLSGGILAFVSSTAGTYYLCITLYLWLMYKEFYVGDTLAKYPLLYAATHQIILVAMALFAVHVHDATALFGTLAIFRSPPQAPEAWAYGGAVLGAFFSYEVCRKLDPKAHTLLKTYLHLYGVKGCALIVTVLMALAAYSGYRFGVELVLAPFQLATVASFALLAKDPTKYKLVEGIATLALLVHLYSGVFMRLLA